MKEFYFFLLLLSFLSCSQTKKEQLSMDQTMFKDILKDLHAFEGGYDIGLFVDTTISENHLLLYDSLFATKGITREEFLSEYDRYLEHYRLDLDSIYGDLIFEFENIRDSLEENSNSSKKPQLVKKAEVKREDEEYEQVPKDFKALPQRKEFGNE